MSRLVLGRRVGERVRVKVGSVKFYVSLNGVRGKKGWLCFEAPKETVQIEREELPEKTTA